MSLMNRLGNAGNPYQGEYPKVLCVCSAGILRSPTLAWILSNPPYNFNTRACGVTKEYALIPYDDVLENWADLIIFVEKGVEAKTETPSLTLKIPDEYEFRSSELVEIINTQLKEVKEWPIPLKN